MNDHVDDLRVAYKHLADARASLKGSRGWIDDATIARAIEDFCNNDLDSAMWKIEQAIRAGSVQPLPPANPSLMGKQA